MKEGLNHLEQDTDLMRVARLARRLWMMDGAPPGAYKDYFTRVAHSLVLARKGVTGGQTVLPTDDAPVSETCDNQGSTVVSVTWSHTHWGHPILRRPWGFGQRGGDESSSRFRRWLLQSSLGDL